MSGHASPNSRSRVSVSSRASASTAAEGRMQIASITN
jgi:hypothetical protein